VPRKRRPRRRESQPLRVSLADRVGPIHISRPTYHQPLMPLPPRSARDILAVLMATLGLSIVARHDAKITLLPGTPTTIVITNGMTPAAAFILPITEAEARRAFGKPTSRLRLSRTQPRPWVAYSPIAGVV
jgi:hypothetical protein